MRTFAALLFFAACALAAQSQPNARSAAQKPNIILILADDLGYGDIGAFGSKLNRTPNLDRMAREGMRLTSFYACPVCTPSRAQFMTGCYAKRVSLPNVVFPACPIGLNPEETTLPRLLKDRGYATMAIGKWHLGDQREFLPTRYGFDHYFGIPYSNDMGGGEEWPRPTQVKVGPSGPIGVTAGRRPPLPLVRDLEAVEFLSPPQQDPITRRYTEEAVHFVRENRNRPFFLYLPHTAVHVPLHPSEMFRGRSANGTYGDWVEELDWSVGQVLDAVRALKLDRRTLVLFTSDNGPWLTQGKNGGTAGSLRGGKGSTWEGGVREPTIAWWPGTIRAGSQSDAVTANLDLMPTFVKLAGGAVPGGRAIDGVDIWPVLRSEAKASSREAHYFFNGDRLEAVRSGPWKLAIVPQYEGTPGAKPVDTSAGPYPARLYNLADDIGETADVSAAHPDVVSRLKLLVAKMDADLGATGHGPGVRPPGRVANPKPLLLAGQEAVIDTAQPVPPSGERLSSLRIGDKLARTRAPQVANGSLRISLEVEPEGRDGILLAHGGSGNGYSLHLREGRVVFTVRTNSSAIAIASSPVPPGRFRIEARLERDAAMMLLIDGAKAAEGKAAGLLPVQPQEAFCLGFDDGAAVGEYGPAGPFRGKIEKLVIVTGR